MGGLKSSGLRRLSNREFLLLAVLLLIFEGYMLYTYLVIPQEKAYTDAQDKYNTSSTKLKEAESLNSKKDAFKKQLDDLVDKNNKLVKEIPAYISQEEEILGVGNFARNEGLDVQNFSFDVITNTNYDAFVKDDAKTGTNPAQSAAPAPQNAPSPAPAANAQTDKKPIEPPMKQPVVSSQKLTLAFNGNYKSLVGFFNDIQQSERKIYINGISLDRESEDSIKGSMSITFVSYKEANDSDKYEIKLPDMKAKDGPFVPYAGYIEANAKVSANTADAGEVKVYNPNFYLILNTYDDNAPKAILGEYQKAGTEVSSDKNGPIAGKFTISGSSGKFSYSYTIDGKNYSASTNAAATDGILRLDVVAQNRKSDDDRVSLVFDVDNKTGIPLEINVKLDDKTSPRFKLGQKSGNVILK